MKEIELRGDARIPGAPLDPPLFCINDSREQGCPLLVQFL